MAEQFNEEDVQRTLGRAYREGSEARIANAERMQAIMDGRAPEDGMLARRELDAVRAVAAAAEAFAPWDAGTPEAEQPLLEALVPAMRAVGEWEGLSAIVDARTARLDEAAGRYGALAGELSPLAAALPQLPQLRWDVVDEIPLASILARHDAATETALEYSLHRLSSVAGAAPEERERVAEALSPELEQVRSLAHTSFPKHAVTASAGAEIEPGGRGNTLSRAETPQRGR